MVKRVAVLSDVSVNAKVTDTAERATQRVLKKTEPSGVYTEQPFFFCKRRSQAAINATDVLDCVKVPLLSESFAVTNPDFQQQNRELFDLDNCICDQVNDLKQFSVFNNVKSVSIVGNLAFSSKLHLSKLLTQSGNVKTSTHFRA
ncbi:uncharacterized protein BXIN_1016 [Babesia sp. Xinjiang]|uniref:uncharacterized protein n=1 Tax=Babesia sp. Xinjiang TaxID=462227 RepID=UPI000A237E17|nr:uncharacterized protein BXIN_1016 [Babesia sp. Xinjiang]ORM42034.1 hypothetical protein BXIN_1016 [Babesia sp. Xinjiang]